MLRLLLLLLLIAFVVAVKLFPWWATAAGLVLIVVLAKLFAGRLVTSALSAPFRAKGKVLAAAAVEVHEAAVTGPPEPVPPGGGDDDEDEDGAATRARADRWFRIDLTVSPKPATGPFSLWEPGELELVDARTVSDEPGDGAVAIAELELFVDGAFREDQGEKVPGPLRLRFRAGVPNDVTRLKLRYYFETLTEIPLPS